MDILIAIALHLAKLYYFIKKKKKDKKKKDWVKTWDRLNFKNSVSER